MPRIRLAIRSGWKTSKSSSFSPVEANRIGWPVTSRTDSAAPPRASPSSLDSTTPVMPTPSRNASAVRTASWPTIASMTKMTSSGSTASRMSAACCIISASMPSRPAVSTMTMSRAARLACSIESRATCTGSPTPLPGSGAYTSTPARPPSTWSCPTALGRWRSAATSSGWWPWPLSQRASLPARVVLPEPWRPASMITVGGCLANWSRRPSPPRTLISSSLTILTICWAGLSAWETSAPRARSLTAAMKPLTTGSATSASSSARRISRAVASMSASVSRPLPRSLVKIPDRRSLKVSNTANIPFVVIGGHNAAGPAVQPTARVARRLPPRSDPARLSGADQAGLVREDDQLGPVPRAQLDHGPADVGTRGRRTDHQPVGDLVVAQPLADQRRRSPVPGR